MDNTGATPHERRVMQRYFIREFAKEVLDLLDHEDILQVPVNPNTGKRRADIVYLKGKKLEGDDVRQIFSEANQLSEMRIWKYLHADIKFKAIRLMNKAQNEDDLFLAKTMLWWCEEAEKSLKKFM